MRTRTLTRDEALREYPMYKIRLWEFLNFTNVFVDVHEGFYAPLNLVDTQDILRNLHLGLFCSLFDSNGESINVFDVWVRLHPERKCEIATVWKRIEPVVKAARKYRGTITFHMTYDPGRFAQGWEAFWDVAFMRDFVEAQREFLVLSKQLAELESSEDFREEVRVVLAKDDRLSVPVQGASSPQTWRDLVLKLAFRDLDNPNYFQFRNPQA